MSRIGLTHSLENLFMLKILLGICMGTCEELRIFFVERVLWEESCIEFVEIVGLYEELWEIMIFIMEVAVVEFPRLLFLVVFVVR